MKPETRDRKEAALVAEVYLNLTRCVGGHIIAAEFMCPHCGSFDPPRECGKEKIAPPQPQERE